MSTHPAEDRLQDYLDDLLCREERGELELHLGQCDACRRTVLSERELRRAFAALPRSIEPERDLLSGIHAAIAGARPRTRLLERSLWSARHALAAAALLLVALTAVVTSVLLRRDASVTQTAETSAVQRLLASERRYAAATGELEAVLAAGGSLTPAALAEVRASVRTIDGALTETRAALRRDPGDPALARLLDAAWEQKLALLRGALRHRSGT